MPLNDSAISLSVALETAAALSAFSSMIGSMQGMGSKISGIGRAMTTGVTVPIVAGLGLAVNEAMKFNTAINNSARTLDLTKDETKAFSAEVLKLAPTLGLLPEQFAKVAAEAGKLGVAKNEVAGFGKVLANLSAISDTPIDQFVEKAGAIKNVFALNVAGMEDFGAAVNALDDKIGGTTPNILEFTGRVGAMGKTMGLSASEVAAFGAVFESVGIAPYRAGTAFNNFANQLFTINAATPKAKAAFESLGYSVETFGQKMAADPKTAMIDFLATINAIQDPVEKSTKLIQIFGKSSDNEIAALATQAGKLSQAFKVANDDTANFAKMQNELAVKMNDPAMQMKVLQAQLTSLGITIGTAILPAITGILQAVTPVVEKMSAFAIAHPEVTKLGIAFGLLLASIGPLVWAIGGVVTGITTLVGWIASTSAGVAWLASAFVTIAPAILSFSSFIGAAVAAVAAIPLWVFAAGAALIALTFNIGGCRDVVSQLARTIVDNLIFSIKYVISILPSLVSGIVNLAGKFASTLVGALFAAERAAMAFGANVHSAVNTALYNVINAAINLGGQFANAIRTALNNALSAARNIAGSFYNAGVGLMSSFADGIRASAASAYNSVASVTSQIRNLLPFSPAKEGALKDLDKSGSAFFKTFANSMIGDDLYNKINGILGNVTLQPQTAGGTIAGTVTDSTNKQGGSSPVVVNYTQNIDIKSSVNSAEIISALRSREREFLDFLNSASFFKNRKQV